MSTFDSDFNAQLQSDFGYYVSFAEHIFKLKDGEEDQVFEEACNIFNEHRVNPLFCIELIGKAANNNMANLHAYYNLLQKLKEEYRVDYAFLGNSTTSVFNNIINAEKGTEEELEAALNYYEYQTVQGLILRGNVPDFSSYVEEKNINLQDQYNLRFDNKDEKYTPIELACRFGAEDIFAYLRSKNIDPTSKCLEYAFLGKSDRIIQDLLTFGLKPDQTCLTNAIMSHLNSYIQTMIEENNLEPDLKKAEEYYNIYVILRGLSFKPLMQERFPIVLQLSNPELISALVKDGYDPTLKILSAFRKPIHYIPYIKNTHVLEELFDENWDANETGINNWTALFYSAQGGLASDIEFLLKHKADINHVDDFKWNALVHAIRANQTSYALALIEAGIDVTLEDLDKFTPLMWAAHHDNAQVIEAILARGIPVDQEDCDNKTALEWAAYLNSANAVKLLLEKGAKPNHKNKYGLTPLQKAEHAKAERTIALLKDL